MKESDVLNCTCRKAKSLWPQNKPEARKESLHSNLRRWNSKHDHRELVKNRVRQFPLLPVLHHISFNRCLRKSTSSSSAETPSQSGPESPLSSATTVGVGVPFADWSLFHRSRRCWHCTYQRLDNVLEGVVGQDFKCQAMLADQARAV
ncbi:putative protein S-acyltransferase 9 [Frankliniella fusca]|uniref:Uncharacterized protein n=1 Tax=Frankliniella fusca TaxID=407009 RepID=A0AAE1HI53_9NEOP|nr:putative protein S-acyltransferase 9 [Frankliniella fusca]